MLLKTGNYTKLKLWKLDEVNLKLRKLNEDKIRKLDEVKIKEQDEGKIKEIRQG